MFADALKLLSPNAAALVDSERLCDLGPGKPDASRHDRLAALSPELLLARGKPRDDGMASACLAGLWLLWDFLDESHTISQSLHSVEGSYWHAIMHRREPDYENSKYWFRRVGEHAIFPQLAAEAQALATSGETSPRARFLATGPSWDPYAFVELCRASAKEGAADRHLCQLIQQREWQLVFAHCVLKTDSA